MSLTTSALALALVAAPALSAQATPPSTTPSPYAGLAPRRIQALSPERERGLGSGAGLGYAMAAELNGHAGPRHVLDLAVELGLTEEQRAAVQASFDRMGAEAVAVGKQILAAEEELDRRFAHRHLDEAELARLTTRLGELEGRLRFVHLRAHLETDALLSPAQREKYVALRGYAAKGGQPAGGHEHRL